jgi:FtsP/CotA-like multicopper oxidase with cupredoxin domain
MRSSIATFAVIFALAVHLPAGAQSQTLLDPSTQPRWVNQLPIPKVLRPTASPAYPGADYYEVRVTQFKQWMGLYEPGTLKRTYTTSWGYGAVGQSYDVGVRDGNGNALLQTGSVPGPTFETTRGRPVVVKWINDLRNRDGSPMTTHLLESAYDTTIHGASMGQPHVRTVVHLHGAEVQTNSDGFPEDWFTPNPFAPPNGLGGPAGNFALYRYPNEQPGTTLWYHDHSVGITRLDVYTGQAGFFFVREPAVDASLNLPSGPYEIPLMIFDRMFNTDGSLSYLNMVNTPGTPYHPKLAPEFFGNVVLVNGVAWPYLNVEPRKYRFHFLNASNARMYNLRLVNQATGEIWQNVWQIGSDGGYLAEPVQLSQTPVSLNDAADRSTKLFLAPAERADVVVDFSKLPAGTTLLLTNDAKAPFPDGTRPDPSSNGSVMLFRVVPASGADASNLPAKLNPLPTRIDPSAVSRVRHLTLTEVEDPITGNPVVGLINNTCWNEPISETPRLGTTEIWEITNTTPDTHPIHVHLVQFNLLNRQRFDKTAYLAAYNSLNGGGNLPGPKPYCPTMTDPVNPPGVATSPQLVPPVDPYLDAEPIPPGANEAGFKDTIRVKKETVTRFLIRFKPQDPGQDGPYSGFSFDPTIGRYLWHCHILEHEDNEMMRPYALTR